MRLGRLVLMRTRTLGPLEVSVVGLGCNNFGRRVDVDGTRAVVDAALEVGVTFLDTAESYGDGRSESFLGEGVEVDVAVAGRNVETRAWRYALSMLARQETRTERAIGDDGDPVTLAEVAERGVYVADREVIVILKQPKPG